MTDTIAATSPSREDLFRELQKVRTQLDKARRVRDTAAIAYAATPDGAAETFRRYELAGDDASRKALKTTYLAGLAAAAEEFEERSRRGNANSTDGPLAVIPVGAFRDPLTKVLVEQRIMGTFRTATAGLETGTTTVTLLRLEADQQTRRRMKVEVAAECGVLAADLTDVVAEAWADTATRKRLQAFLGDATAAVTAAMGERMTQ